MPRRIGEPIDPKAAKRLEQLADRIDAAQAKLDELLAERAGVLTAEHERGVTNPDLAAPARLTAQRVHKIVGG